MAVFSAYTIIRSLALFHITLAVFLLRNPKTIADQNIVFILGESMQLVRPLRGFKYYEHVGHNLIWEPLLAYLT